MHHIYHTEGIILGSKTRGEAGKYYSIFTRDLGMIYASASGVRKLSSKLRYVLVDFGYVKVDLVEGKDFWRITSASKTNQLEEISKHPESFKIFSNIAYLLRRLLAGVEKNEALFADLIHGLSILEKLHTEEDLRNVEVIIVLRTLHHLGYAGGDPALDYFIEAPFEENLLYKVPEERPRILREINKALKETHL